MKMRAMVWERFGPPEVLALREVSKPTPKKHQVLIAVGATSVTAACTLMRRGDTLIARLVLGLLRPRRRFRIPGIEVVGVILEVGPQVKRFRPGDRVYGFTGFSLGAYAEFVCLCERASIAPCPAGLSDEEACSLVDGATTALYFLRDRARLGVGERIAIIGASGSIGTAAVQLSRYYGAHVTAVCSGKNRDLVRALGAHQVIDYTTEDFSAHDARYDVVFDTVGKSSFHVAKRCLKSGGRYLLTLGGPSEFARDAYSRVFGDKKFIFGMSIEKRKALETISELVSCGALRPVIDCAYSLETIVEAHRYVESGRKRGNVVVRVRAG